MKIFGYEIKKAEDSLSKNEENELFRDWLPNKFRVDTSQRMISEGRNGAHYIDYRGLVLPDLTGVKCPFAATAIKKSLDELIDSFRRKQWFNICPITNILETLGLECADDEARKKLHHLHCVHWEKMHPDVIPQVVPLINKVFGTYVEPPPPEGLVVKE